MQQLANLVGTLRIPAFLVHDGLRVDSRSVLADSLAYIKSELKSLFKKYPKVAGLEHINGEDIEDIVFTSGTELEFWVKTPVDKAEVAELSASQAYARTILATYPGLCAYCIRTNGCYVDNYGLKTEMGHKEVGGLKPLLMKLVI